ncbi:MAG TPA: prepilin-type N-terminal cleavage/methylation domain-containing protein [Clostridiales bacterium]|nr:prepilin-type N-terminal cleavage/methylation domain-containing protein [Clostridiales bacterium]
MKKAFSLIELIIVLAVIGILAAILIPVISNAVDKANAKAALSDARNALTGYESYAQANEMSSADVVFIVLKAKRLYVYGLLAGSGKLSESVNNPYELESKDNTDISAEAQALLEKLLDNGSVIPSPSQNQVNITEKLADTPCTVQVFYGYRLQSFKVEISFEKSVLDLAIDDIERLTVFTDPETDIEFISSDPEIVSVNEFGIATAKALGSVTITATNGFVSAYCKVNVLDYIEAGTLEELKHLFENTGTQTVFIRIINSYGFGDVSLLPLCVPENKYVRVDFSDVCLWLDFNSNELPDCVIKNLGGKLMLENKAVPAFFGGIHIDINVPDPVINDEYFSILKNETGTLIISNQSVSHFSLYSEELGDRFFTVYNRDKLFIYGYDSDPVSYNPPGVKSTFLRNASGAHATLRNMLCYGTIINEGALDMRNCRFFFYDKCLINTGDVQIIQECEIVNGSFFSDSDSACIENYGNIGDIINSVFFVNNGTVLKLIGGEANSIKNCQLCGGDNLIEVSADFTLKTKLTDGMYFRPVPEALIASGYACIEYDGYYYVVKQSD